MDISFWCFFILIDNFLMAAFCVEKWKGSGVKAGVGEQMRDERKRYKFAIKTEAKWL